MQSGAGKRVLSTLASRLHPQLPLSPRDSQQLLNLLTTSFRTHLDREHPLNTPNNTQHKSLPSSSHPIKQRNVSPARATSSYASTARHIDSILTNPLFAVTPRRRGSESAAVHALRDPMAWFLNEIATGAADLHKADICLQVLAEAGCKASPKLQGGRTPATVLAEWLQSSGLDTSEQFLDMCLTKVKVRSRSRFLAQLTDLLMNDEKTTLWRWFIRSSEQRVKETGLEATTVRSFRQQLLRTMVSIDANASLNSGLATFMQALRVTENEESGLKNSLLNVAGINLVYRIISNKTQPLDPKLYQSFLSSSQHWFGSRSQVVQSMLWLHHPTGRSFLPGLRFIQDPNGALAFVNSSASRKLFIVQLCLEVARHALEAEKYADAQVAMDFSKKHFADLVLPRVTLMEREPYDDRRMRKERENLELLDRFVPA